MNFDSKEDEIIFNNLCVANGIDRACLIKEGSKYEKLEIFFSGFSKIIQLCIFPNLSHLAIINQPIRVIENLDVCTNLVSLWICECEISNIEGLDQCGQIRNLYLYDNKITKIKNLYYLRLLETLWLNNNRIDCMEGLDELLILRELNLAGNLINCVGNSLKNNISLEKINLSGNLLKFSNDLLNLSKLPKLKYLTINGPDYVPNPVFYHINFYLFMIYHFPNLKRLDTFDINSSYLKDIVLNIINKKKLFYFMKIESLERDTSYLKHQLKMDYSEICKNYRFQLLNLTKVKKLIEMNLFFNMDSKEKVMSHNDTYESQILEINSRINSVEALIESFQTEMDFFINKAEIHKNEIKNLYQMEFSSCGNFKFEYSSEKIWVNLCNELINSRFCNSEFNIHDFQQIKTHRVIKIKNFCMENDYAKTVQNILDMNDENEQFDFINSKMQDYLFLFPEKNDDRDLKLILNSIYFSCDGEVIQLTNSLFNGNFIKNNHNRLCNTPYYGRVIIFKAFIGYAMINKNSNYSKELFQNDASLYEINKISVNKCAHKNNCLCSDFKYDWYFRTNKLLVPEYIVDFEYLITNEIKSRFYFTFHGIKNEFTSEYHKIIEFDKDINILKKELESKCSAKNPITLIGNRDNNSLNSITVLNLTNSHLKSIPEISSLLNLSELTVSFNNLLNLKDISLEKLNYLDVSYNQIQALDEMHELPVLTNLNLQNNFLIRQKEEISVLYRCAPSLINLNLKYNLFPKPDVLRLRIISKFKNLKILNDVEPNENELKLVLDFQSNSRVSESLIVNYGRTDTIKPRTLVINNTATTLLLDSDNKINDQINDISRFLRITSLCVSKQSVSKISNLEKLENLKYLALSNNYISKIEGLDNLTHLEELNLDNNIILKIENLSKLQKLKKLSLNENYINSVLHLRNLQNLQCFSVHTNKIISLNGLEGCISLMELYIGNNCITDASEIANLKNLNDLIILDLQNNPIVNINKNYRLNVIFHLKHLKGLDGICVDNSEIFQSKDILGGRLNFDFIREKIRSENYSVLNELDLSNCCLKSVDLTPVDKLRNLRSLNLENNNLTSFSGLISLCNLKVLCLNSNSIESILPKFIKTGIQPIQKTENIQKVDLKSLEVLHLGYNNIRNISSLGLHDIPFLKALFLQGNDISTIDGLEYLPNLRELVVDQNRIKSISETSFINNINLREIHLDDNRLKNVANVFHLKQLKRLYIGNNKISDLHDLDLFYSFESLIDISLYGNPVSRRHQHRQYLIHMIPTLIMIDGVEISEDEKLRVESNMDENTDNILPGILNQNRTQNLKSNSTFYNSNDFNKIDYFKGDSNYKKRANAITSFNLNKTNSIQLAANSKAVYFYDPIGQIDNIPRLNFNKRK